jgi:hypothetical protein
VSEDIYAAVKQEISSNVNDIEVAYFAHPLAGNVQENIKRAKRWLRWLMDYEPNVAFCCPWLPFVDVLDEGRPDHRRRGLRDDIVIARRCDGIVLCGGRISNGMRMEMEAVVEVGGWVADLTKFGEEPPVGFDPDLKLGSRWKELGF